MPGLHKWVINRVEAALERKHDAVHVIPLSMPLGTLPCIYVAQQWIKAIVLCGEVWEPGRWLWLDGVDSPLPAFPAVK